MQVEFDVECGVAWRGMEWYGVEWSIVEPRPMLPIITPFLPQLKKREVFVGSLSPSPLHLPFLHCLPCHGEAYHALAALLECMVNVFSIYVSSLPYDKTY